MADIVGDEKEALLAETAAVGTAAGGAAEVGDFRTYLGAYYRHVALEDLTAAGARGRRPGGRRRQRSGPPRAARPRLATSVPIWAPTTGTSRSRTSPPPGR